MTTNRYEYQSEPLIEGEQPALTTLELLLQQIGQPYTEEHRKLERDLANILAITHLVEEYEKMRKIIEAAEQHITHTRRIS